MRKLPILLILAIIVFCSCQKRQDRRLFRWSDLSAETDSIVQSIEQGYINLVPEDSLLACIDQLERETDILKTNPEFPYIFKAKIYYRKGLYDSANILIERADALCDSIKHPYEKQRINIFKSKSQNAYLRNFEFLEGARKYAIQTNDTFLLAITCNSLGVLFNELEDSIQSKDNTNKAIECYKAVNMHRYARSVELNLLVDIFKNGDTALFKSTINAMKADEALMRDSVFRVNLMMDAASYLREDWAIDSLYSITTRPHGLSPVHESKFIAIKADQCRDRGEFKRGYDYSLRSIEIADKSKDIDLMVSLYPHHALFCFLVGMPDSAYLYHQWAFLKMDSIRTADTRTKILRATERYEIEKSVLAKKNEETKRLLIISLVVSAIVILILGFLVWLSIRNGRLKLEAERAKTDTERNRQLLGQTMVRLHQKNQSIIDLQTISRRTCLTKTISQAFIRNSAY